MSKLQSIENFYEKMIEDFKGKLNLSVEEIIVLEAVSFKLEEIERKQQEKGSDKFISNSKFVLI